MSLRLVVERKGSGAEVALLDGDTLLDLHATADEGQIGDGLFRGRISRLERNLDGAFVDIGPGLPEAFVLARDIPQGRDRQDQGQRKKRSGSVSEGRKLIVQGRREAEEDKGPRVTANLQIKGRFLVYRPNGVGLSTSPRLRGKEREEQMGRLRSLVPEGAWICRRLVSEASDETLSREAEELAGFWRRFETSGDTPGPLPSFLEPVEALVWQLLDHPITAIEASDDALLVRLRRITEQISEQARPSLVRIAGGRSAFEETGVSAEIERACAREVPLSAGGRLIIEATAACVAIDVDGGGRSALEVDIEAAGEIGTPAAFAQSRRNDRHRFRRPAHQTSAPAARGGVAPRGQRRPGFGSDLSDVATRHRPAQPCAARKLAAGSPHGTLPGLRGFWPGDHSVTGQRHGGAAKGRPKVLRCPLCGKPRQDQFRPFCSKRCRDVDLARWLDGSYAVPAVEGEGDDDPDG